MTAPTAAGPAASLTVVLSDHAVARAAERSGHDVETIKRIVADGYLATPFRQRTREILIAVDGPIGRATAVVEERIVGHHMYLNVITIRESESCGQGERASEPLTYRPFADALGAK